MQVGCHGLVWTGSYDAHGIRHAVASTAAAGFDLIEFPLMDPATFDVAAARSALDEHGILASGSLGLSESTDLTSADPAIVRAGEDLLNRAVDVLADLGSTHLCGVLYSAMRKYQEPPTPHGRERSGAVLGRVAERAAAAGIGTSLEVVNRYETNLITTAAEARSFLDDAGLADRIGLHLDTYHMNIEETDMQSPVLATADRLSYVHIGESHRGYLGTGSVDFAGFFRALHHIGYDGPIVFESFSSAVASPSLSNALGIWRNLWQDSADLGAHANGVIRAWLRAQDTLTYH